MEIRLCGSCCLWMPDPKAHGHGTCPARFNIVSPAEGQYEGRYKLAYANDNPIGDCWWESLDDYFDSIFQREKYEAAKE